MNTILLAGAISALAAFDAAAQGNSSYELDVINQLATKTAVSTMPVSQLLNARAMKP